MSPINVTTSPPSSRIFVAVASNPASSISAKTSLAPSCAKRYGHEPAGTSGVTSITVDKGNGVAGGGSGYTSAPTVIVAGSATATATINNGKVQSIAVDSPGSGYSTAPSVTFSGGGGSGATATAHINVRGTRNVSLPFGGFPGAALG